MRLDDVAQRLIWKTLLVIADVAGAFTPVRIVVWPDALRTSRDAEAWIRRNNNAAEKRFRLLVLIDRERRGAVRLSSGL